MDDFFNLYVDQLQRKSEEEIRQVFLPDFIDLDEDEVLFLKPVEVSGVAYLADDELILQLTISTEGTLPCKICNEPVNVPIEIQERYFAIPLAEIKTGIFDLRPLLREVILTEMPFFAECGEECPERKEFKKYIQGEKQEDIFHPFDHL